MLNIYTQDARKEKIDMEELSHMEKDLLEFTHIQLNHLDEEQYASLSDDLNRIVLMQQDDGTFPLAIDSTMPNDCRYYYVSKPTYIILKLLIECQNRNYEQAIKKCIEFCKKSQFLGHGYDDKFEQLENLIMLIDAGLLSYADNEMSLLIHELLVEAKYNLKNHKTVYGFGDLKNLYEDFIVSYNNAVGYKEITIVTDNLNFNRRVEAIANANGEIIKMETKGEKIYITYTCNESNLEKF